MKKLLILCVVLLAISFAVNLWQRHEVSAMRVELGYVHSYEMIGRVNVANHDKTFQKTVNLYRLSYPAPAIGPNKQTQIIAGMEVYPTSAQTIVGGEWLVDANNNTALSVELR